MFLDGQGGLAVTGHCDVQAMRGRVVKWLCAQWQWMICTTLWGAPVRRSGYGELPKSVHPEGMTYCMRTDIQTYFLARLRDD